MLNGELAVRDADQRLLDAAADWIIDVVDVLLHYGPDAARRHARLLLEHDPRYGIPVAIDEDDETVAFEPH